MITTPNRLATARRALEEGEQVDWRKLKNLQALDLVIAGRELSEQAILSQEEADERIFKRFDSETAGP